jgi:hypothetical protein
MHTQISYGRRSDIRGASLRVERQPSQELLIAACKCRLGGSTTWIFPPANVSGSALVAFATGDDLLMFLASATGSVLILGRKSQAHWTLTTSQAPIPPFDSEKQIVHRLSSLAAIKYI